VCTAAENTDAACKHVSLLQLLKLLLLLLQR
jgi:hypothetical protein